MKAATSTERVKASKLRAARALAEKGLGKKLSAPQRAFLERYDRDHPPRQPPTSSTVRDVARPSSPRASVDRSGDRALDFGKPQPAVPAPIDPNAPPAAPADPSAPPKGSDIVKHDPNATLCPVGPGCPGCLSAVGPPVCITTQRRQFPMMDDDAAKGQAGMLLGGASFLGKLFRSDHAVIKFDEDELGHFAKVWARFVHTRASYLAQGNDITALVFVGGLMVAKVATAETPPAKSAPSSPTNNVVPMHRAPNA